MADPGFYAGSTRQRHILPGPPPPSKSMKVKTCCSVGGYSQWIPAPPPPPPARDRWLKICLQVCWILQIQGAIICASVLQVAIEFSGILGFLLKFVGPLTITPTITLIGLSLWKTVPSLAEKNWWIAMGYGIYLQKIILNSGKTKHLLKKYCMKFNDITNQRKCTARENEPLHISNHPIFHVISELFPWWPCSHSIWDE